MNLFKLIACLVFILQISGCFLAPEEPEIIPPPLIENSALTYRTFCVETDEIKRTVNCTGYIIPSVQTDLSFMETSGYLKGLYVNPGDFVEEGQIIAELYIEDLDLQISMAQHTLEFMQNDKVNINQIAQLEIQRLNLQLNDCQRKVDALTALGDSVSGTDFQTAQNELQLKKIDINLAQSRLNQELQAIDQNYLLKELELEGFINKKNQAVLKAPISGIIDFTGSVKEGQFIGAREVIIRISDNNHLMIQYNREQYQEFRTGMSVSLKFNGFESNGKVVTTPMDFPVEEYDQNRTTVIISPDNYPENISIGDAVDIYAVISQRDSTLVIPRAAVSEYQGRKFVKIFEDNFIREIDIITGLTTTAKIEVLEGLSEGMEIIY